MENNIFKTFSYTDSLYDISLTLFEKPNNFGYIELRTSDIFWDHLEFFMECDYKEFKKECKEDCEKAGIKTKKVYKTIKDLIKAAIADNRIINKHKYNKP